MEGRRTGQRLTQLQLDRLSQQLRNILGLFGVEDFDSDAEPHLATIRQTGPSGHTVSGVPLLRPYGFYAIPADADAAGEPIAVTLEGMAAILAILDHRYGVTGDPGEVGLHNSNNLKFALKSDKFEMTGGPLEVSSTVKSTGYKVGSHAGKSVIVTYLKDLSGNTGTMTFSGGILIAST